MSDPKPPATPTPPRTRRDRKTSPRVLWVDRITTLVIKTGGIFVIVCVIGIFVFLLSVVKPLFDGAEIRFTRSYPLVPPGSTSNVLFAEIDEYQEIGAYLLRSGELVSFSAQSGEIVSRETLVPSETPLTAFRRDSTSGGIAVGLSDGSVRLGHIRFATTFLPADSVPPEAEKLAPGMSLVVAGGVLQRTAEGEVRRAEVEHALEPPLPVGAPGVAVTLIDYRPSASEARLATLKADHTIVISEVIRRENLMTGEVESDISAREVAYPEVAALGEPFSLLLTSQGDQLYLAWTDGTVARFDLRDAASAVLAERQDLVPGDGVTLTDFRFMLGEQSLLAGDSAGNTRAWFKLDRGASSEGPTPAPGVQPIEVPTADGVALVPAHTLAPHPAEVTRIAVSQRDKTLLVGGAGGDLWLHHLTSEQTLGRVTLPSRARVEFAQITPKGDGLFAIGADGEAALFALKNPHPETTWKSLFGSVWYEGSPAPGYTWQSSSGTDDFEPKLSLVPLIFGTMKATLYSLLFAVPIALLAAIYTSEFLDRRYRGSLKTTIEIMASLPSVVLGFIAALVLAPLIESAVLAVLLVFALGPLAALGFGYLWQILPPRVTLPLRGGPQLAILFAVVLAAILAAYLLMTPLEGLLFSGDFKGWLDGRVGTGAPGIGILVWPLCLILLLTLDRSVVVPALGRRLAGRSRSFVVRLELVKFVALLAISLAAAAAIALAAAGAGLDPRPELFGTYVQRNALIVGFVMGFAVIPIIYTISEDALGAVPETLRSASLGCGATRWQTATRVVVPVALSGIFSALMIGLGRAVGETMIVLMAAGNTPLIDLNVFNGLRTLSANIAVELPEAVKDGTLYRVLFLAALTLFVLTFAVNTVAEIVRQRVRRRNFQL